MAAVWKLPLILVIENNRYAFSTPAGLQYAARQLSDRGIGYGVAAETVDGNDPDAMAAALHRAVARARAGQGPTLIEAMLGRMRGHAEGDDSLKVVPAEELAAYRAADPVPAYARRSGRGGGARRRHPRAPGSAVSPPAGRGRDHPGHRRRRRRPRDSPMRPVFAPAAVRPPGGGAGGDRRSVGLGNGPVSAGAGAAAAATHAAEPAAVPAPRTAGRRAAPARPGRRPTSTPSTRRCARRWSDESVLILGQDIGAFEGAFRTTRGLHARWPDRVSRHPDRGERHHRHRHRRRPPRLPPGGRDAVRRLHLLRLQPARQRRGQALLPLAGPLPHRRPPPLGRRRRRRPLPLAEPRGLVRPDRRHQGPLPATAADARGLLKAAIRDPNPVMLFEHKFLYRRIKRVLPNGEALARIGEARVLRQGAHLTLVAYGASTWTCLEAAAELAQPGSRPRSSISAPWSPTTRTPSRLGQEDRPRADRPRGPA